MNVYRDCDADRTKYATRKGFVDFEPLRGLLTVEEFGKKPLIVRGSPQYICHIRDWVRMVLNG